MTFLSRLLHSNVRRENLINEIRKLYLSDRRPISKVHSKLSSTEVEGAMTLFKNFDVNKDNSWTSAEFQEYIKWSTDHGLTKEKMEKVFNLVDANKDGTVSLDEFLNYVAQKNRRIPQVTELENLFYRCDENGDGLVNMEEVRYALTLLGDHMQNRNDLRKMFSWFDGDHDGLVNKYEFISMLQKKSIPTER